MVPIKSEYPPIISIEEFRKWWFSFSHKDAFRADILAKKMLEAWCVMRLCEVLQLNGGLKLDNDEPTDIELIKPRQQRASKNL
jgi:hypothetical protein